MARDISKLAYAEYVNRAREANISIARYSDWSAVQLIEQRKEEQRESTNSQPKS